MTAIHGKVAALTGAASGLGRALALALVKRGAHVALADIDPVGLEKTVDLLRADMEAASQRAPGRPREETTRISTHQVDVSDAQAVQRFAREVEEEHGGVDLIINNAGTSVRARIDSISYEDIAFVLNVNLWGVIHGTKAFLPLLRKRPEGHIVNIGSVNAFLAFPENAAYTASKYAVLGWSETLGQELQGDSVRVTCVHPGATKTNIVRSSRGFTGADIEFFDSVAKMSPAFVAERTLRAVERNRQQVVVGSDARFLSWAKRIAPSWILRVVGERLMAADALKLPSDQQSKP